MYNVYFYKDRNGRQPVLDYLKKLSKKKDKHNSLNFEKMNDYIEILRRFGTRAGLPYIKHVENEIWELRPLRNRILFVAWKGDGFVLLHHFIKMTQKTPKKEILKARREYADLMERSRNDEKEDSEKDD
ncbi:MAG: type II toxin-antitoxin system RelE/ParE family toxin [Lachnospiraceae bacterium]|nr:type II toxin-antitoxin system RelE/ParE family toxin [Lachnospiraceae bacterium]